LNTKYHVRWENAREVIEDREAEEVEEEGEIYP